MSDTARRAAEPQDARPLVGPRGRACRTCRRHGTTFSASLNKDPNGWDCSAVRPIGSVHAVAHDQVVIFAGRQSAHPLANCSTCGRVSGPYWWRWRAYRLDDPEFGELPRLAIYCQSCADRKFGAPRRRPLVERRKAPRPQTQE